MLRCLSGSPVSKVFAPVCNVHYFSKENKPHKKLGSVPTSTQMVHLRTMKTTLYVSYCTCFIKLLRLPSNSLHACAHRHVHTLNLPHTSGFQLHIWPCAFAHTYEVWCLFTLKFMQLPSIWSERVRRNISDGPDVI